LAEMESPAVAGGASEGCHAAQQTNSVNTTTQRAVQAHSRWSDDSHREFLLGQLRTAGLQARLCANVFDQVGIALRAEWVDCTDAVEMLAEENLLGWIGGQP
jgi:hypothetical protein